MKRYLLALITILLFISNAFTQVTIIVDAVPTTTPVNANIYVAGSFNNWSPNNPASQLAKSGSQYKITLNGSGTIQFKFTRGSWNTVEGSANGGFLPNRTYTYSSTHDTIYLQILSWEDISGPSTTAAANVSILSDSFYMPQLNRYRRVWVYLPLDYHATTHRYPVLYMHDGQNLFDDATAFGAEWEIDETLNDLHAQGDSGIIVIGIDNGGGERINEYSPWNNPNYGGGNGDSYVDFIVHTLKPHIDSVYRTISHRDYTGIMGSSMGGFISTYAGTKYQNVFGKIGAFSPSYWFSGNIFNHVTNTGYQQNLRIFQLAGGQEVGTIISALGVMENALLNVGFDSTEIKSVVVSDGQHSEWFWAREFGAAYLWLFRSTATSTKDITIENSSINFYPNPVKDSFSITFDLEKASTIQVQVSDSQGQMIRHFNYNELAQGEHLLHFTTKSWGLRQGVYFCKLQIDDTTKTFKFLKTK